MIARVTLCLSSGKGSAQDVDLEAAAGTPVATIPARRESSRRAGQGYVRAFEDPRQLGSRGGDAQLAGDVAQVDLDGLGRDVELAGDLPGRQSPGGQDGAPPFAGRQRL